MVPTILTLSVIGSAHMAFKTTHNKDESRVKGVRH